MKKIAVIYASRYGHTKLLAEHVASGAGGVFPRGVEVGVWLGGGLVQPSVPLSSVEDVFIRRAQ